MSQLVDVKPGEKKTLMGFENPMIGLRLLSMGIQPGTEIWVRRTTFNGQTYYIHAGGKNIAVRKKEAASIRVQ